MRGFGQINFNTTAKKSVSSYLERIFMTEKLQNKEGFAFLTILAGIITLITVYFGVIGVIVILVVVLGLPAIYGIVAYPKFGIITLLVSSYFIMYIIRMNLVEFPLGTLMDAIQALLILGFFIKQKSRPNWKIFKDPIGIMMLIWIFYNIFQVANPTAESKMAWLYTIRSIAVVMLMYFIFTYHIRDIKFIRLIIKIWLILGLIAAIYAFKQEYIGFFGFEEAELRSERLRKLLFIAGKWRKFSIFSDPVAFSYNMATCGIFCISMLFSTIKNRKKIVLAGMAVIYLSAMLFSGTRGAYVLIPASIGLLTIINFNKRVFFFTIAAGFFLLIAINIPSSNSTIRRFQSAFKPSNDASFNLRSANQKRIQPFIQSHPFGGGLGATGVWGARFSPNSFLAKFPPDSGYVRVAIELGWVGLFIFCALMFTILKTGINNYYKIKDPELKRYSLAMILIVFAYMLGNYPQEALVQFPSNIYFYFFTALLTLTYRLDQETALSDNPSKP